MRSRGETPLPEESGVAVDDTTALARIVLDESDQRQEDRTAAPGSSVEHRTSEEATPPTE